MGRCKQRCGCKDRCRRSPPQNTAKEAHRRPLEQGCLNYWRQDRAQQYASREIGSIECLGAWARLQRIKHLR